MSTGRSPSPFPFFSHPLLLIQAFYSGAVLARVYHANRTLSLTGLKGSNVGWDMPIEKENLAISMNVTRASFPAICRYVRAPAQFFRAGDKVVI
eukprot:scaffold2926_cov110-Isochrysis_galbana.AAC.5